MTIAGKVVMVTGANAGIGKATATALAKEGANVIMVCRDLVRGAAALDDVQAAAPHSKIDLLIADLSVPSSVRAMVASFYQKYERVEVLINNAAVYKAQHTLTADGLELMFATNHLGHFLLTNLLLDRFKPGARIIHVTAPSTSNLNFDDLQGKQKFSPLNAFGASKMCNLLFNYALADRLAGTGVTSNALHPGLIKSNLTGEMPALLRWGVNLVSRPPERAAAAALYLASSSALEGVTGKFFKGKQEIAPAAYALDKQVQDRLWQESEKLAGLSTLN